MPPINKYKYNKCTFSFPDGWGGNFYVIDNNGDRKIVGHPLEDVILESVLGKNYSSETFQNRTGFNSYCVCVICQKQFILDLGDGEKGNPWR